MKMLRVLALLLTTMFGGLCVAQAQTSPGQEAQLAQVDPTSAMCLWGIMLSAVTIGHRCYPGQHSDLEAALNAQMPRLETYLTTVGATPAMARTRQQLYSMRNGELCHGESAALYANIAAQGPAWAQTMTDQVLSGANHDGCF